jgi:hypothetical protein
MGDIMEETRHFPFLDKMGRRRYTLIILLNIDLEAIFLKDPFRKRSGGGHVWKLSKFGVLNPIFRYGAT